VGLLDMPSRDRTGDLDAFAVTKLGRHSYLFAVVDGAGVRVDAFDGLGSELSRVLPHVVIRAMVDAASSPGVHPRLLLSAANRAIRDLLNEGPYGQVITAVEGKTVPLIDVGVYGADARRAGMAVQSAVGDGLDSRYLRLTLPACVATVAIMNAVSGLVSIAHVGDTSAYDVSVGSVELLTPDQMGPYDQLAVDEALAEARRGRISVIQAAGTKNARQVDLLNGVRHQWLSKSGKPSRKGGVGVLNGMRFLDAYVATTRHHLRDGHSLALMSDGASMLLEQARGDDPAANEWRSLFRQGIANLNVSWMRDAIARVHELDARGDQFPRLKRVDDATCVVVRLEGHVAP
jgi:serine/threonine protein phosphatase PrpC